MSHHTRGRKSPASAPADALVEVPNPPAWLDREARAEWRRIMPSLIERRILSPADNRRNLARWHRV
jgi:phage terminase small subunit